MRAGDWPLAVNGFGRALRHHPGNTRIRVQLAHALKESGRYIDAKAQYETAAAAMPTDVDVRLHLAGMLRSQGDRDGALAAYAAILRIDASHRDARLGCIELGGRDHLPTATLDPPAQTAAWIDSLRAELRKAERDLVLAGVPLARYDLHLQRHPPSLPPQSDFAGLVDVIVLAQDGHGADAVRRSLTALDRLEPAIGRRVVVATPELLGHPVASAGHADGAGGTSFVLPAAVVEFLDRDTAYLIVDAGAAVDAAGLAWLRFAHERTRADTIYGDHDTVDDDWDRVPAYSDPRLYAAHDPCELAATSTLPIAALVSGRLLADTWAVGQADASLVMRRLLTTSGHGLHIPQRIASRHIGCPIAPGTLAPRATTIDTAPARAGVDEEEAIAVVIPTRDEAAMLTGFVDSLFRLASKPARLRLVVVDNRSVEHATHRALKDLARDGGRIVRMDEPFNWSRANNLGVTACDDASILVFANNDMTMVTSGWDKRVSEELAREKVGLLGARLHFPDETYQHAGILSGVDDRTPFIHEAVGLPAEDHGPADRWRTRRQAAAVTGAFMATKRTTFEAVGGFDEKLAVAYNDIDFCLRVRANDLRVIYAPDIRLVHHESKTRGRNVTRTQIAWDKAEYAVLYARWSSALSVDPSYNPRWARGGRPFDGLREPGETEIIDWIDRQKGGGWRTREQRA